MFAPKIISCAKTRACTPNPSCPDEFKIVSILSQYRKYTLCCCCCSRVKFKIRFLADRQTSLTNCFVFKDAVLVCIKLRVCLSRFCLFVVFGCLSGCLWVMHFKSLTLGGKLRQVSSHQINFVSLYSFVFSLFFRRCCCCCFFVNKSQVILRRKSLSAK